MRARQACPASIWHARSWGLGAWVSCRSGLLLQRSRARCVFQCSGVVLERPLGVLRDVALEVRLFQSHLPELGVSHELPKDDELHAKNVFSLGKVRAEELVRAHVLQGEHVVSAHCHAVRGELLLGVLVDKAPHALRGHLGDRGDVVLVHALGHAGQREGRGLQVHGGHAVVRANGQRQGLPVAHGAWGCLGLPVGVRTHDRHGVSPAGLKGVSGRNLIAELGRGQLHIGVRSNARAGQGALEHHHVAKVH
mmetsp:Transcript_25293/g.84780  ORF Transcript_25293/g.84780 Transcript_25293/m.84780 type:complete len:251 (+) Transcript_25293:174-926(+)